MTIFIAMLWLYNQAIFTLLKYPKSIPLPKTLIYVLFPRIKKARHTFVLPSIQIFLFYCS